MTLEQLEIWRDTEIVLVSTLHKLAFQHATLNKIKYDYIDVQVEEMEFDSYTVHFMSKTRCGCCADDVWAWVTFCNEDVIQYKPMQKCL